MRVSSYIELLEWIVNKKAWINPRKNDEQCFKWAVIAALHHKEIWNNPGHLSKLQHFENQYNWNRLEFPLAIQNTGEFEKNNPGTTTNVLFNSNKGTYKAQRSELYGKCRKQGKLMMIVDGENRHYTAIKNLSRLLKSLNATHKESYHFCMNCLNGFHTASASKKYYSSNGHVKVQMPSEKENG